MKGEPTATNLLRLAVQHYSDGALDQAESLCRQLLQQNSREAGTWSLFGALALKNGDVDRAVERFRRAVTLMPDQPVYRLNLGEALRRQGDDTRAIQELARAVLLDPNMPEARYNLGLAYVDADRPREAAEALQFALSRKPELDQDALFGDVLRKLGEYELALRYFETALARTPGRPLILASLGAVLQDMKRSSDAIRYFEYAIELDPDCAIAHINLGLALKGSDRPDEGLRHLERGLELEPRHHQALANYGTALLALGRVEDAVQAMRQATAKRPHSAALHSNLLFALCYHPEFDARAQYLEARQWYRRHAAPLEAESMTPTVELTPCRRLRIGYMSAEFRDHVETHVTLPLLLNHDHEAFEIHCFSAVKRQTRETTWLYAAADEWHDIASMTDRQTAEFIASQGLDILVNLGMHQGDNRTRVCAYRPAPIQISWLAYPGTTGCGSIDYRITDPYLDPPGTDLSVYSEQSLALPNSFWCYDPLVSGPAANDLPAATTGYVTLGSLNRFTKINDAVLKLWARLLSWIPTARLLMVTPPGECRTAVTSHLKQHRISAERVEFLHGLSREQYLETYHRIDVCLDPFPYNGGITSLDAFWMGVPVVTLRGATAVGRAGTSIAMNLGLPELVADNEDEYVEIVHRLAGDLSTLTRLRRELRDRMEHSALMDGIRFARDFETLYQQLWRRYCEFASQAQ